MARLRVTSTMTGVIASAAVSAGETVKREQPLLVLEVMKMEIPVEAPAAGRVLQLHVAVGEQVQEGQLLVTLET
jgi:biotin carboxyl carrier protein